MQDESRIGLNSWCEDEMQDKQIESRKRIQTWKDEKRLKEIC